MPLEYRTVSRFVGGRKGRASKIQFESLRKGDYFFLEESNGDMVVGLNGCFIFKALSKPRKCPYPGHPTWINYTVDSSEIA